MIGDGESFYALKPTSHPARSAGGANWRFLGAREGWRNPLERGRPANLPVLPVFGGVGALARLESSFGPRWPMNQPEWFVEGGRGGRFDDGQDH